MATTLDDFERRRRDRETSCERAVCWIVAVILGSYLVSQLATNAVIARDTLHDDRDLVVVGPVIFVTAVCLVVHLALLAVLTAWPGYDPRRKYVIVVMRVALMGFLCWAEWFNHLPYFGVLVPSVMFMMLIVLSGLTFSRRAVLLAGGLSAVTYCTMTLLGPTWPLSVRACVLSTQSFALSTAITYQIVDGMLGMHRECVASEHLRRFFSPEVAARIAAEPEVVVRAVERPVTVLFADISGFTAMSSTMTPQRVVDLLNAYFPPLVEVVFRHGGTLEKFIGDAIVAIWGAPFAHADDADRAVAAAIDMQRVIKAVNASLAATGQEPIAIHVGLCSGLAAAGYIGTDRYVQYAVIGDTTNVASRVCSAAEAGQILIADSTRMRLVRPGVSFEALSPVAVKGKAEPLLLHRIRPPEEHAA